MLKLLSSFFIALGLYQFYYTLKYFYKGDPWHSAQLLVYRANWPNAELWRKAVSLWIRLFHKKLLLKKSWIS